MYQYKKTELIDENKNKENQKKRTKKTKTYKKLREHQGLHNNTHDKDLRIVNDYSIDVCKKKAKTTLGYISRLIDYKSKKIIIPFYHVPSIF